MRSLHARPHPRWLVALTTGCVILLVVMLIPVLAFWLALPAPKGQPRPVEAMGPAPVIEPEAAMPSALWDAERMELLLLRPILKGRTP